MDKRKFKLVAMILLACFLFFPKGVLAEDGTGSPGSFLRTGVGIRALGMGKAFVAVANDQSAAYWNPAGLSQIQNIGLDMMYLQMPFDRTFRFIGTSLPFRKVGTFAVSWIGLQINNLEARDSNTRQPDYYFTDSQNAFLLSYGKRVSELISVGLNVKWIHHKLDANIASGIGFDAAVLLFPIDHLRIGFSYNDIGTTIKWNSGYTDFFPYLIRFGAAYELKPYLLFSTGLEKISGEKVTSHFGAEINTRQNVSFQFGVSQNRITSGINLQLPLSGFDLTVGYGMKTDNLADQYIHVISINISGLKNQTIQ